MYLDVIPFFQETNAILDNISSATIYLFHQQTEHHSRTTNNSQAAALLDSMPIQSPKYVVPYVSYNLQSMLYPMFLLISKVCCTL